MSYGDSDNLGDIIRYAKDCGKYKDLICAFDIETSRLPNTEQSFMYVWQLSIDNRLYITGREWDQFLTCMQIIAESAGKQRVIIYVHNLSFEFQFLSGIYKFGEKDVFAVKARKILYCLMNGNIEFRCSYLLTNVSLREFLKEMNVPDQKKHLDYSITRYPWTELTADEKEYNKADVVGLIEALKIKKKQTGDTWDSIPYTQTGYVRRDAKKALRPYYQKCKAMRPTYEQYILLREAFRGGNTHANRYYVGDILKNVGSIDIASSYPSQIVYRKYPMNPMKKGKIEYFMQVKYAWLSRVHFTNIRLKDKYWGFPFIPMHKTRNIYNYINDNGRVLEAEILDMTITDIDYDIIKGEYEWDKVEFYETWGAPYRYLPRAFRQLTLKYFYDKTEFKGVEGKEVEYQLAKQKINSLYGMSAQDPGKQKLLYYDDAVDKFAPDPDEPPQKIVEESTAFLPYQWGVWVTAWARYQLEQGLKLAGDNAVYCDTDSVKYLGDLDIKADTKARVKEAKENKAYAKDNKGVTRYLGVFEYEGKSDEFRTWGAKRYATRKGEKLNVTVSGVVKQSEDKVTGAAELQKKGGMKAFAENLVFEESGGARAIYNDDVHTTVEIDGHILEITKNVTIEDRTYTLSLSKDYSKIISEISKEKLDNFFDVCYNMSVERQK